MGFCAGLGDRWLTGNLKTYVYRVWPRIDKQQERVYITIVQQAIDEQYLLENFGSGRYLVLIKDSSKLLRKHTASVHNRSLQWQRGPEVLHRALAEPRIQDRHAALASWTALGAPGSTGRRTNNQAQNFVTG